MFKIVFDNITVTNEKLSNFLRGLNTTMSDQAFRIFSTQLNLCCSAFLIFGNQSFGFKVFKILSLSHIIQLNLDYILISLTGLF